MNRDHVDRFCSRVCAHVHFSPDRAAITAELTAHLEDHAAALEERGITAWLSPAGDGVWSGPSLSILFAPYFPGAASLSSILLLSCRGYDTDGELVAFCD